MKTLTAFFLVLLAAFSVYPQTNQNPVVNNVNFALRKDTSGVVDITYDVSDADNNLLTISVAVSSDAGLSWNFSCSKISGDVGSGITPGTNKKIAWDFYKEHPSESGDNYQVRITADDGTPKPCATVTVNYSGKTYNAVQIGTQCWLKENLDVGNMIIDPQNQVNNGTIEKYCYDNNSANCNSYGGLYQWAEAVQYKNGANDTTTPNPAFSGNVQGICPNGWHIPTSTEFKILSDFSNSNSNSLKAIGQGTGEGAGTNSSGYSALLSGFRFKSGGFGNAGFDAISWSTTESDMNNSLYFYLNYSNTNIYLYNNSKSFGFSVRCLID